MAITGLVLTLARESGAPEHVSSVLTADPRFEVGELAGHRLPVVMDTPSSREDRAGWTALEQLPGVTQVELACTFFDEGDQGRG